MAGGAAGRYANAVFSLAQEQETVERWSDDLQVLKALVSDSDVTAYLNNPRIPMSDRLAFVDRALDGAQPEAKRLGRMLVERRRLLIVLEMVAAYEELVLEAQGIAIADVTTAVEMDAATEQAAAEKISEIAGQQVELRTHVDPSIMGGIVVRIGDNLIDGSVSSQLHRLQEKLAAT